jgi:RNA polymerase sigma factor (TIGR02999 family)
VPTFSECRCRLMLEMSEFSRAGGYNSRAMAAPVKGSSPGFLAMSDVTRILSAIEQGDPTAAEALLPLVYGELRKLAARRLAHERAGQTLEPTALVHEAYLRVVGTGAAPVWNSRGHFFAAAATAMRRIVIERARRKRRHIHGGDRQRQELRPDMAALPGRDEDLLALDAALSRLAEHDPVKARLVELRYFAGLTGEEAGEILGISPRTADRYWVYARAWLRREMDGPSSSEKVTEPRGAQPDGSSH